MLLSCTLGAVLAQEAQVGPEETLAQVGQLHAQWKQETNPKRRAELGDALIEAAIHKLRAAYDDDEEGEAKAKALVNEVTADGKLAATEIRLPEKRARVRLSVLRAIPIPPHKEYSNEPEPVIRRITKAAFELWMPRHGWLFDSKGQLLNEARPPRRDGSGREWYGAFLPDGRWVTTDLWDYDKTLTFFSRSGKWAREVFSDVLLPPEERLRPYEHGALLTWARSDREGKGWVVFVGENEGRGAVWIGPSGAARSLGAWEPWKLCYPRALGPRGFPNIHLSVPDDRQERIFSRSEAGHGPGVGYPHYSWSRVRNSGKDEKTKASEEMVEERAFHSVVVADGETFGFWPGSQKSYVSAGADNEWRTWFFDEHAHFEHWIAARRIADAADGRSMLFGAQDGSVVTVSPDGVPCVPTLFEGKDGARAEVVELFADLQIGFFKLKEALVLARWPGALIPAVVNGR